MPILAPMADAATTHAMLAACALCLCCTVAHMVLGTTERGRDGWDVPVGLTEAGWVGWQGKAASGLGLALLGSALHVPGAGNVGAGYGAPPTSAPRSCGGTVEAPGTPLSKSLHP